MNSAHWPGVINNGHTTGKSIAGLHGGLYCHGVRSKVQCSIVVVFQMLVGSVAADTKATNEMLTHSTTTETVERTPDKRNRHTTGKSIRPTPSN